MSDQAAAAVEAPAPTEDQSMAELYDRLTAEGIEEEKPEEAPAQPESAPETAEEAPAEADAAEAGEAATDDAESEEGEPEPVEAPSDLPTTLRKQWANIPEEARDAVLSSHRELSRRMAEQGRALRPIHDVLIQAAQEIPTIRDMTPEQVARDVFSMARIQGELAQDPVKTLLGIAQRYGATEGIKQALGGQSPDNAAQQNMQLVQEVKQLRAMLQQQADPQALEQRVMQTMTVRETERMVQDYASGKEHWGDVENVIPQMIPVAQQMLGEGASAKDVLDRAYDMAIHAIPDLRAKVTVAAAPAPAQPDPARAAAQRKAKSVNVKSTSSGKPKPMNEDERLAAIWDKHKS